MIRGFENYTEPLTTYEKDMLVPILVEGLRRRVGGKYAIRNKEICRVLTEKGYQGISEPRIRKCINYIRVNGLVPHLVANRCGYYVATSVEEVERYAQSLEERAQCIWAVRAALLKQLSGKLFL